MSLNCFISTRSNNGFINVNGGPVLFNPFFSDETQRDCVSLWVWWMEGVKCRLQAYWGVCKVYISYLQCLQRVISLVETPWVTSLQFELVVSALQWNVAVFLGRCIIRESAIAPDELERTLPSFLCFPGTFHSIFLSFREWLSQTTILSELFMHERVGGRIFQRLVFLLPSAFWYKTRWQRQGTRHVSRTMTKEGDGRKMPLSKS